MKINIVNDAEGCPAVSVVDDTGAVVNSVELAHSQQVTIKTSGTITVGAVLDVTQEGS